MSQLITPPRTREKSGTLSPTSYTSNAFSYDEWLGDGKRFYAIGKSLAWWIGDWLLHGEEHFGDRVHQAVADCGYEYETIRDSVRVCKQFPQDQRSPDLSFAHHRALISCQNRQEWIDKAVEGEWSVAELRTQIRSDRRNQALLGVAAETHQSLIAIPPYGDIESLPEIQLSDPALVVWIVSSVDVARGMKDLQSLGLTYKSMIVLRPPVIAPNPRSGHWTTQECSYGLVGVRGDLKAPMPDDVLPQIQGNLSVLRITLERAYPQLSVSTLWVD
tara:strand:+ start:21312 stop:22133 length:822 start_codon:yes stop_codon:yes gene_type:complete